MAYSYIQDYAEACILFKKIEGTKGLYEIQLPIEAETEKAICFNTYSGFLDHKRNKWIPKSQCEIIENPTFGKRVFVTNWAYNQLT